jgi:hypothetical protein
MNLSKDIISNNKNKILKDDENTISISFSFF